VPLEDFVTYEDYIVCLLRDGINVIPQSFGDRCTIGAKQAENFSPYLCQILTDFQKFENLYFTSSAAMQLRCGGMFINRVITNFPLNVPVKKFLKICQYLAKGWMDKSMRLTFLAHPVFC